MVIYSNLWKYLSKSSLVLLILLLANCCQKVIESFETSSYSKLYAHILKHAFLKLVNYIDMILHINKSLKRHVTQVFI